MPNPNINPNPFYNAVKSPRNPAPRFKPNPRFAIKTSLSQRFD